MKFEIDKMELVEDISESQLTKVRMFIVSEGENKHNLPISWEAISASRSSLVGKPILCKYNQHTDSFEGHEIGEIPVGCFLNEDEIYENEIDGKRWLVADAYIWKAYFPHIVEVFRKNDGESSVSMEIEVLRKNTSSDGVESIELFVFMGVTLIGVEPAIENAKAVVLKFSEFIEKTKEIVLYESKKSIDDKEENLINEVIETTNITPTEDDLSGKPVNHIECYKEPDLKAKGEEKMEFSKKEFANKVSLTTTEIWSTLSMECGKKKFLYNGIDCEMYSMNDYNESVVFAYNYEDGKLYAIPYSFAENKFSLDFENVKLARLTYVVQEEDDEEEVEDMSVFANKILKNTIEPLNKQIEDAKTEISTYIEKNTSLESENKQFAEDIEKLSAENKELKEYKTNTEEAQKTAQIEFAIQDVSDVLTPAQIDEWRSRVSEFENVTLFDNAIKAFAFSLTKDKIKPEGILRMGIPDIVPQKPKGLWD
jgi:FtsZ-binding cell division protein ZapB